MSSSIEGSFCPQPFPSSFIRLCGRFFSAVVGCTVRSVLAVAVFCCQGYPTRHNREKD